MNVAGGVDLWTSGPVDLKTCGLWVVDRISIMHIAGGVDLWTCGPVGCRQNIDHVCRTTCGPVDLWTYGLWTAHVCSNGCSPYSKSADLR